MKRLVAVVACIALMAPSASMFAEGNRHAMVGADLQLNIDTRWAGGQHGGYWPIRVAIENRGATREITVLTEPIGRYRVPSVSRTVRVESGQTARITLSLPMVFRYQFHCYFRVLIDGEREPSLRTFLSINTWLTGTDHPVMIAVSDISVDPRSFHDALRPFLQQQSSTRPRRGPRRRRAPADGAFQTLEAEDLPEKWIDYSGVDFVTITLSELESLKDPVRAALSKWTTTGGHLIVYDAVGPSAGLDEIQKLLRIEAPQHARFQWRSSDVEKFPTRIQFGGDNEFDNSFPPQGRNWTLPNVPGNQVRSGQLPPMHAGFALGNIADKQSRGYWVRSVMHGTLTVISVNPFSRRFGWGPQHWLWLLRDIGMDRVQWTARTGISSRQSEEEFLRFLNASVSTVPRMSLILLITLFTVLIGPLNYFLLWRKKKIHLLLVSIPFVAFATSMALFGYSVVANGLGVKSKVRSVTLLDQRTNQAVSVTRASYFAGFVPSQGMQFSSQTAAYPLWSPGSNFESGSIDWTEGQHLQRGWLRSRTRTQFVLVEPRTERGRLAFDFENLKVENGFEIGVRTVIVADPQGHLWKANEVPAGGTAELTRLKHSEISAAIELFGTQKLQLPSNYEFTGGQNFITGILGRNNYSPRFETSYQTNLAERELRSVNLLTTDEGRKRIHPRTYAAVMEANPGIDLGLKELKPSGNDLHVIIGLW